MGNKSFYDLDFSVEPGGARKGTHYVRATLDEIKHDLAGELADSVNLNLLCWYGAHLSLNVYQEDKLVTKLDLHPLITIEIEGYPTISFAGPGKPLGYDFRSEDGDEDGDEEAEEGHGETDGGSLSSLMFGETLGPHTVTVAWERLAVPPLTGELAAPGDIVDEGGWELPYGFSDLEE